MFFLFFFKQLTVFFVILFNKQVLLINNTDTHLITNEIKINIQIKFINFIIAKSKVFYLLFHKITSLNINDNCYLIIFVFVNNKLCVVKNIKKKIFFYSKNIFFY